MHGSRYSIHIISFFLLSLLSFTARADKGPPRINFSHLSVYPDTTFYILPFSRAGNLIVIKARVDTMEGNFILDTGCPNLVLNHTYFRDYPLNASDEERNGATGAEFKAGQTSVAEFLIGPFHYYHVPADLVNLGNIENSKGIRILGLIGMEFLKKFEMIIDYDNYEIHLQRIGRRQASSFQLAALKETTAYRTVPITITDNRIMVQTTMEGKKLNLIIDSGAESNLLDSRLPDKIFEHVSITGRTVLNGAGNSKIEVLKGDLRTLRIGNEEVGTLPVLITNLERTCFSYGGCVDGILGFDFLSLKKIGFNFVTNKMYIWK